MNESRRNRKSAASNAYHKALKWMASENPQDADLSRIQREAAELLGLEPTQSLDQD